MNYYKFYLYSLGGSKKGQSGKTEAESADDAAYKLISKSAQKIDGDETSGLYADNSGNRVLISPAWDDLDEAIEAVLSSLEESQEELFGSEEVKSLKPAVATVTPYFDLMKYPMFKEDQPRIGRYSQASPENMAKMIIFVVCSQQTDWSRLMTLFPIFWEYLVSKDGFDRNDTSVRSNPDLQQAFDWWKGKSEGINDIWKHRSAYYSQIMRSVELDAKNGDTGFLVYRAMIRVPLLGLPKAGFAVQLLTGHMGCIDSVNLNILGSDVPKNIMDIDSKGVRRFKGAKAAVAGAHLTPDEYRSGLSRVSRDKKNLFNFLHGALNRKSFEILRGYADYLDDLKSKGTTSEMLWNVWCEVIFNKVKYVGGYPIDVTLPNQSAPARVFSYKMAQRRFLEPELASLRTADNPALQDPKAGASKISKQHKELIVGENKGQVDSFLSLFS